MKKVLLLLSVSAMVVALFASAALSQQAYSSGASASASAGGSATATGASASALAKTGGPSYVPALASAAALALIVSGLAALRLVVRRGGSA